SLLIRRCLGSISPNGSRGRRRIGRFRRWRPRNCAGGWSTLRNGGLGGGTKLTQGSRAMPRTRLDSLLVERRPAASRERARALILAGQVLVDGRPASKAGDNVPSDIPLSLLAPDHPYVSRGGLKLAHALDQFHIDVIARTALDIGASTGGFTDVLLHRGA